ncbi:MAG: adenosylcobinamide-GDP ribazoletransferase [Oligoflexia bacterium]|nr:adenosylcobinamide-GDP ribazoletransferase [Oligoflexia bacterium]
MPMLKREFTIFIMALMYFTRIPLPHKLQLYSEPEMKHLMRYFPLVGMVIALLAIAAYKLFLLIPSLPYDVTILLTMGILILATGALHEDGLGDVFDAFGGGAGNREKILHIMKDSRLGTFGVIALILNLLLKFSLLKALPPLQMPTALLLMSTLARYTLVFFLLSDGYAGNNELSKSKSLVDSLALFDFTIATLCTFSLCLLITSPLITLTLVLILLSCCFLLRLYFKSNIGGYTGDTLGASEQIFEILILLTLTLLFK